LSEIGTAGALKKKNTALAMVRGQKLWAFPTKTAATMRHTIAQNRTIFGFFEISARVLTKKEEIIVITAEQPPIRPIWTPPSPWDS
jgi:hypothetical protein